MFDRVDALVQYLAKDGIINSFYLNVFLLFQIMRNIINKKILVISKIKIFFKYRPNKCKICLHIQYTIATKT